MTKFLTKQILLQEYLFLQSMMKVQIKKFLEDCFVVQEHRDKLKVHLIQNVSVPITLYKKVDWKFYSIWIRLFLTNVIPAYLKVQRREINTFLHPPKEINLKPGEITSLMKIFYGFAESDDYWDRKFLNPSERSLE